MSPRLDSEIRVSWGVRILFATGMQNSIASANCGNMNSKRCTVYRSVYQKHSDVAGLPPLTTPHHHWMGCAPNVAHPRTSVSPCCYVLPTHLTWKLDDRYSAALFLGY